MPRPAPVTSHELQAVLKDLGVEMRLGRSGFLVATIDGAEIRFHGGRKEIIGKDVLGRIAKACGAASYSDLLASLLNREPVKAGRPSQLVAEAARGVSKQDAREACTSLRQRLLAIDSWLARGTHSEAVYGRIRSAVVLASRELSEWPPAGEAWESPDDAGYAPSRPDPLTTGVARVVGRAATAVKRKDGMTKWQYEEGT